MTTMQIVVVVIVAIAVIVLIPLGLLWWRHRSLRSRFGPEYDRLVSERDSRLAADRELHARERKHRDLQLRPLDSGTRERYAVAWRDVQGQFVDSPDTAIGAADELLTRRRQDHLRAGPGQRPAG